MGGELLARLRRTTNWPAFRFWFLDEENIDIR